LIKCTLDLPRYQSCHCLFFISYEFQHTNWPTVDSYTLLPQTIIIHTANDQHRYSTYSDFLYVAQERPSVSLSAGSHTPRHQNTRTRHLFEFAFFSSFSALWRPSHLSTANDRQATHTHNSPLLTSHAQLQGSGSLVSWDLRTKKIDRCYGVNYGALEPLVPSVVHSRRESGPPLHLTFTCWTNWQWGNIARPHDDQPQLLFQPATPELSIQHCGVLVACYLASTLSLSTVL
jgi:hypothetical protein